VILDAPISPRRHREGLLPRLVAGPAAVSLATRRLARASLLGAEMVGYLRSRPGHTVSDAVERMQKQCWFTENLCVLHGIESVVEGPLPTGPCVIVANHLSYVDPLAICVHVQAAPIIKAEVRSWPVAGDILAGFAGLFVDRGDAHSGARVLLRAREYLAHGLSVVGFPEGTTTAGDRVLPFKRGLFGLAKIANVPVVPVAVRFEDPDLAWVGDAPFMPHYMRLLSRDANRVYLRFGDPIDPSRAAHADALADESHAILRGMARLGDR
jgi:1-acyl-sn-glycerol-3-phosphate acyltransferase